MFVLNVLKKMGSLATSRIWTNHNDEVENRNVGLQEINYSMFNDEVEHLHIDKEEDKQLILDEIIKYEKLERQIIFAERFVENMMEDSKCLNYKFDEICSELRDNCLSSSKELNAISNYVECLNVETEDLNKNYKFSKEVLIKLEEENVRLEENINKLEKCLFEEYKNKTFLIYHNENQKMCLEYKCEKIAQEKQALIEKTDELKRVKEETNDVLKAKLDDYASEKKKLNVEKSLQINMVNKLKKELEMEKSYGQKFNQTICRQKNKNQELNDKVEKLKEEYELLKQTSERESIKTSAIIKTLRAEKTIVDLERRKVETEFNQNKKELDELEYHTEQLSTDIIRRQCKLDKTIKNIDDNNKLSMERVEKKRQDFEELTIELNAKEQCILKLRTTLSEKKKLQKRKSDEVRNLKTQLNDLKCQQINTINFGKYPDDGDHNMINCNPQTNCENIREFDNFSSAGENIINSTPFAPQRTKSIDDFEEKNRNFENLIETCKSLVNNYD